MRADVAFVKRVTLTEGEIIYASIRCAVKTFIYSQVYRPGILVATDNRLIFVADAIKGNEITEIFNYEHILDIKIKRGIFHSKVVMTYKTEIVKFSQLVTNREEELVEMVRGGMKKGVGRDESI